MFKEITFEKWKEQFKPIENAKIFASLNEEDYAFIKEQSADTVWTIHFDKLVVNRYSIIDTDNMYFVTEVPFSMEDRITFTLPEDYIPEWEWGQQRS